MDFSHIVGIIFPVLTIVVGGACVLLFGVTTTLRAQNGDLTQRVDFLDDERTRLQLEKTVEKETLEAKLAATKAELAALAKVVTGETQLVAITDLLEHHHSEALRVWAALQKTMNHTDQTLNGIRTAIEAQGRP